MNLAHTLRFLRALLWTNLKASFALRGAFWLQVVFMTLNDLVWLAMWWVFFARFPEVGGWQLADFMVLHGVLAGGYGLVVVLAGGVRELARTIEEGDLDVFLTQPKPPLLHVVSSKTRSSGWGDLAYGVLAIALSGRAGADALVPAVTGCLCCAVVFLSTGILVHSLAFWLGPVQTVARQSWEFLIIFAGYPDSIFSGAIRVLLFTLVPAAFVSWFPASLVREFSWPGLGMAVGGAFLYGSLALLVFHRGLVRYASGNRLSVRA